MAGGAPRFARFGGIRDGRAVIRAALLSGGLAGLGGAIEVIGVQYRLVGQFSALDEFDGIIVALVGQLQPVGVLLGALFLGGIRLGALNGLQMVAGVPRELGSALIALFVLFVSMPAIRRGLRARAETIPDGT
jgi:simple sugar transport system permease protein